MNEIDTNMKVAVFWIMCSGLPTGPLGALIRAVSFTPPPSLSLYFPPPPLWPGCGMPPLSYWLPCPHLILTLFPTGPVKVLPWLSGSYICSQFLMCGLLIALIMKAASTSETLVNFYQTTQHYNSEDSHLHTCRCENFSNPTKYLYGQFWNYE
jgi:hypothetical protein